MRRREGYSVLTPHIVNLKKTILCQRSAMTFSPQFSSNDWFSKEDHEKAFGWLQCLVAGANEVHALVNRIEYICHTRLCILLRERS